MAVHCYTDIFHSHGYFYCIKFWPLILFSLRLNWCRLMYIRIRIRKDTHIKNKLINICFFSGWLLWRLLLIIICMRETPLLNQQDGMWCIKLKSYGWWVFYVCMYDQWWNGLIEPWSLAYKLIQNFVFLLLFIFLFSLLISKSYSFAVIFLSGSCFFFHGCHRFFSPLVIFLVCNLLFSFFLYRFYMWIELVH